MTLGIDRKDRGWRRLGQRGEEVQQPDEPSARFYEGYEGSVVECGQDGPWLCLLFWKWGPQRLTIRKIVTSSSNAMKTTRAFNDQRLSLRFVLLLTMNPRMYQTLVSRFFVGWMWIEGRNLYGWVWLTLTAVGEYLFQALYPWSVILYPKLHLVEWSSSLL